MPDAPVHEDCRLRSRKDLETRIAQRLESLAADDVQRLAEDYVRLRFPDRFSHFDFRALSREGRSRSGWPDAYVILPDGRIDGVEATTDKSKPKIWRHLEDDIAKARDRSPKLSGFVFVSGQPTIQPAAEELNRWRRRFADEGGLEPDRVDLVFGGQLVQELARPEFARTRVEILGLTDLPVWFELVRLNGPPGNPHADFVPSSEDFEGGWVHRSREADRVLGHLEVEGRALLRGVGASGKTVLAWLLALETARQGWPAYYLDLAGLGEGIADATNGMVDDLIRFGHPHVLFILDNIHLNEYLATQLALAWEEFGRSQRPRLLLVGRELRTGRGSAMAGIEMPIVPLMARQDDVRGVYRRLVRRKTGSSSIPEPPPDVLDHWVTTFGGDPTSPDTTTDLIAFSAAVLKRLGHIVGGIWNLTEKDAVDEIREAYLKKLGDGETRNLMRLASLAEAELPLTEETLVDPRASFDVAGRKLGLVFREHVGAMDRTVRYRLAHPALGRLLLAAAFDPVDPVTEQRFVGLAYPVVGFALSRRLEATGQVEECRALLGKLMEDPARLLELGTLLDSYSILLLLQRLDAVPLSQVGNALVDNVNRPRLVERALSTPLVGLQTFLVYAAKTAELKLVSEAVLTALGNEEHRKGLVERGLLTPLGALQSFLVYAAKTEHLRSLAKALVVELGKEQQRKALVERALLTPLGALQAFLAYAETTETLRPVFAAMVAELGDEKWRQGLVERAFLMPPTAFPRFLKYAAKTASLRPLARALIAELAKDENRRQIVDRAWLMNLGALQSYMAYVETIDELRPIYETLCIELAHQVKRVVEIAHSTPLSGLSSFLVYAENTEKLKPLFKDLVTELGKPEHRRRLAKRIEVEPIGDLVGVLSADNASDLWKLAFLDVDAEQWQRNRLPGYEVTPNSFVVFQRCVAAVGRPDLTAAPALNILRKSRPAQWHRKGIGLHHLSHVLRCATSATDQEIRGFLEQIATDDWIDYQVVTGATTGGLAGSLLALSASLPTDLRKTFLRSSLRERVMTELTTTAQGEFDAWSRTLSLLGAAAAIGLQLDSVKTDWPCDEDLSTILELRAPVSGLTAIGPLQIQLWLGLREMVRLRDDTVSVPSRHGDAILSLWRAAHDGEVIQSRSSDVHAANARIIAWLERCRENGWRLNKEGV